MTARSQTHLLLAVGALELLLEPAVDAARMEDVAACEGLHLLTSPQHRDADRAAHLCLLTLDFFAFALSEAVLRTVLLLSCGGRATLLLLLAHG